MISPQVAHVAAVLGWFHLAEVREFAPARALFWLFDHFNIEWCCLRENQAIACCAIIMAGLSAAIGEQQRQLTSWLINFVPPCHHLAVFDIVLPLCLVVHDTCCHIVSVLVEVRALAHCCVAHA